MYDYESATVSPRGTLGRLRAPSSSWRHMVSKSAWAVTVVEAVFRHREPTFHDRTRTRFHGWVVGRASLVEAWLPSGSFHRSGCTSGLREGPMHKSCGDVGWSPRVYLNPER